MVMAFIVTHYAVRNMLCEAQAHIQAALKTLDKVSWPTKSDYDQV